MRDCPVNELRDTDKNPFIHGQLMIYLLYEPSSEYLSMILQI